MGNEKIIKLLVQNNATSINAIDASGHTALDAVVTSSESKLKLQTHPHFMHSNFVKKHLLFFSQSWFINMEEHEKLRDLLMQYGAEYRGRMNFIFQFENKLTKAMELSFESINLLFRCWALQKNHSKRWASWLEKGDRGLRRISLAWRYPNFIILNSDHFQSSNYYRILTEFHHFNSNSLSIIFKSYCALEIWDWD